MDYEKKYKNALEKAKEVYNRKDTTDGGKLILESMFPELKENEDERIRKELIKGFQHYDKECKWGEFTTTEILSWLEKQGKKSNYNPYKATIESISAMVEKYAPFDSNLQDFYDNIKVKCKDAMEYDNTWLEKQSEQPTDKWCEGCNNFKGCITCTDGDQWAHIKEQKPVDKVQPKFKVGDWIVYERNDHTYQIHSIDDSDPNYIRYVCKSLLDNNADIPSFCEEMIHLWTIQDAKDGDVLVCYSEAKGNPIEQTGIFKQYVGRHGGCSNTFLAHTGIDWDGNIIINGYMGSTDILPATKKQRNLLFQKMKEESWEWDAEKKELWKIDSAWV